MGKSECCISIRLRLGSSLIGDESPPKADVVLVCNPCPALALLGVVEGSALEPCYLGGVAPMDEWMNGYD